MNFRVYITYRKFGFTSQKRSAELLIYLRSFLSPSEPGKGYQAFLGANMLLQKVGHRMSTRTKRVSALKSHRHTHIHTRIHPNLLLFVIPKKSHVSNDAFRFLRWKNRLQRHADHKKEYLLFRLDRLQCRRSLGDAVCRKLIFPRGDRSVRLRTYRASHYF